MRLIARLFAARAQKESESDGATKTKREPTDVFAHPPIFWQAHREPDGAGGISISYHVRDDIVDRALKKMKPIRR